MNNLVSTLMGTLQSSAQRLLQTPALQQLHGCTNLFGLVHAVRAGASAGANDAIGTILSAVRDALDNVDPSGIADGPADDTILSATEAARNAVQNAINTAVSTASQRLAGSMPINRTDAEMLLRFALGDNAQSTDDTPATTTSEEGRD